jgi:hypothetical protein
MFRRANAVLGTNLSTPDLRHTAGTAAYPPVSRPAGCTLADRQP